MAFDDTAVDEKSSAKKKTKQKATKKSMRTSDRAKDKPDRSRRIFCDLLRPELVRRNGVPLSSDAFSNFQAADKRASQLNGKGIDSLSTCSEQHWAGQVRVVTRDLHERIIPDYADSLPMGTSWSAVSSVSLVEGLHSRGMFAMIFTLNISAGINVRHLGLVRSHIQLGEAGRFRRRLCLTEMCARMVKNQVQCTDVQPPD